MPRYALALLLGWGLCLNGWAQVAPFTYQGFLVDSNRPATGLYDFLATLRDAPAGSQVAGTPVLFVPAVAVTNGLFTAILDFRTNAFSGSIRWLELSVRTNNGSDFTTLHPTQPLTPAPSAIFAQSAGTAANAITVSNGVYLTGSYTNPPWLASVPADKITGQISDDKLSPNVALLDRNYPFGANAQGGAALRGWMISTPYSQYEPPARTLHFKSGGVQNGLVDGVTGDGFLQLESNLARSNSLWISYYGSIWVGVTNTWLYTNGVATPGLPVLRCTVSRSSADPILRLGGNINLPTALLLNRGGAWLYTGGNFVDGDGVTSLRTNLSIAGTLFSSTTPIVNTPDGETDLLHTVIPACALTNNQDTISFFTSGRFSRAASLKQLRFYYGSSLIGDTGTAAQSNLTWTVRGRIVANADGTSQYVTATLLWNSRGAYASTNWSLTTSETNGLDALLRITGTSAARSITNELLQVEIKPGPLYTTEEE